MKVDKSWYIKPKDKNFPTAISSGGIVLRKNNNKLYIALIKDNKFNEYMLPKGRVEKGELLINGARREIAEETGLSELKYINKIGIRERLTFDKNEWRKTHYFLFITKQISGKQKLEEKEKDYVMEWFDFEDLPTIFWPEQRELIEENKEKIINLLE